MTARPIRKTRTYNFWPGFVDVLSTLLIVILFMLLVFILAHFFLGRNLDSKNSEIVVLQNRMTQLTKELSLERKNADALGLSLTEALNDAERLKREKERLALKLTETREAFEMQEKTLSAANARAALLTEKTEQMTRELERLSGLLAQSEAESAAQKAQIVDLGKQLNRALAQKVSELSYYRSDFFGKLRKILEDNDNISIVGDRFVFQSELFFKSGSAELEEKGKRQLDALARVLLEIAPKIPENINWIIRVDGHTDNIPIRNDRYASNWQLSADRALTVVYYLQRKGVPSKRLAAAGFGEFHPLAKGNSPQARRRNRRIEFKLTEK